MKSLSKVFAAAGLAVSLAACSSRFPQVEFTYNRTPVFDGITTESLDNTTGTVSHAIIHAPQQYQKGVDTIAQVDVGSVRACFTQAVDAATVNSGYYRVDCVNERGEIVSGFSLDSEWQQENKHSADGKKVTVEHTLHMKGQLLP
jgi:hypothetical protein